MTVSLNKLIKNLPNDLKKHVDQARKQFLQVIQSEMRKEAGLLLNRNLPTNTAIYSNQISIPIKVKARIPGCLQYIELDLAYKHIAPLIPYHSLLMQINNAGSELLRVTNDIERYMEEAPEHTRDSSIYVDFEITGKYAKYLAELIDKTNPLKQILGINEDVLGAYDYTYPDTPKIYLYWAVIGIVANLLSIRPETLTCVALAHELAHGYSHVGTDIDGERWDTDAFHQSDLALKEGIAQYYTHLICKRLNSRIPGMFDAYDQLLEKQPEAYRTHLSWIEDYSPEIVRMAIIEARRNNVTAISDFESILTNAASRLYRNTIVSKRY